MLKLFEFIKKNLIKSLEQRKVICINCGTQNTLKIIPQKFTTWKCNCGVQIFYPAHQKRDYGTTVFISFTENMISTFIKEKKLTISNFEDYLKVYNSVLSQFKILPESKRYYEHYLKRQRFDYAKQHGKFR